MEVREGACPRPRQLAPLTVCEGLTRVQTTHQLALLTATSAVGYTDFQRSSSSSSSAPVVPVDKLLVDVITTLLLEPKP
jgi:hypothetical protein